MTTVSVVTIAWRNARYAAGFATSLAKAAERIDGPPVQLLVVTNGGEGEEATKALLHACDGSALSPTVVPLNDNEGFSGGANAGLARCEGQIIVLANLDLTFDEAFLQTLYREAASADRWDFLAPRVLQGDSGTEAGVSHRRRSHRLAWSDPPGETTTVAAGNGACIVMRRAAMEQRQLANGSTFDAEFHSFNEDIDLFWWADRAGLIVRYVPDLLVRHALGGSFGGQFRFVARPVDIQRRVMSNYRLTVWKNGRGPADWLGWLVGEAEYLGQSVASNRLGGMVAYATSWVDALRTARAIRQRRGRLRPSTTRS